MVKGLHQFGAAGVSVEYGPPYKSVLGEDAPTQEPSAVPRKFFCDASHYLF